jgi:DNA-binding HxlR family transcriptional regulator
MARTARHNPVPSCPLTAAVAAIGGKWKLIIIYHLSQSPQHFAALRRLVPGISQKVLTDQLRELQADGIVGRRRTGSTPAPVIYSLSAYGMSLLPLLDSVLGWGRIHLAHRERTADRKAGTFAEGVASAPSIQSHALER